MRGLTATSCFFVMAGLALAALRVHAQSTPANRFEPNVAAYEAADRASAPPHGAILLVGDSQFYRWKTLAEDLPGYTVVNRGIDSLTMKDLAYFADRLVVPYEPRLIVIHAGGNDINTGRTPRQLLEDFQQFVRTGRAALPAVPIAFSSTTPGPGRWQQAPQRREANRLVKEYVATQPGLLFVDLWDAMLTADGQPREDLWVEDRIHPNQKGYQIRVQIMRPILGPPDRAR